ncbi:unnamed protein product [Moneuplotes crassus]|uniref:Uncharacterized protein n=1 Tax=Euplotes crassus TaxID=5936 RepID=A0AAD1XPQ9_EUPCR|nr:unnamed protein product [Moneuplotes crassus]
MSLRRISNYRIRAREQSLNQKITYELSKTLPFLKKQSRRNRYKSQKQSSLASIKNLQQSCFSNIRIQEKEDTYDSRFHFGHSKSFKLPIKIHQPQSSESENIVTIRPYNSKMMLKLKETGSSNDSRSNLKDFEDDSYSNLFQNKYVLKKKKLIKQYLKKQKYTFAREFPLPLLSQTKKQSAFDTPKKYMGNACMKHEKEGFMRRNKLLLEYLIHERLKKKK